jgi:opacity protein-like surface antigen
MAESGTPIRGRKTTALAVVALVVVAAAAAGRRKADPEIPPEVAGWYGAMELYRALALWAGKRAMAAEVNYWKAARR